MTLIIAIGGALVVGFLTRPPTVGPAWRPTHRQPPAHGPGDPARFAGRRAGRP
jgi:hypothetical protein